MKHINFIKLFPTTGSISFILLSLSLILVSTKGLYYGLDFVGGAELHLKFQEFHPLNDVRSFLENTYEEVFVQELTSKDSFQLLVKLPTDNLENLTQNVQESLNIQFNENVSIEKSDLVGPKAGKDLKKTGIKAIFLALIFIMLYIALRFDFIHGPAVVLALIHDILLLFGFFALLHFEFTLQTLAAVLTVMGYSVNNTVIIFDRLRELIRKKLPLYDAVNQAIRETFSRTMLTTITTLIVSITMVLFTSGSLKDFFIIISLGVLLGTFFSIFLAAPFIYFSKPYLERLQRFILGDTSL